MDLNKEAKKSFLTAEKRRANGAFKDGSTETLLKHCAGEVVEAMSAYAKLKHSSLYCDRYRADFKAELADIINCVLIIAGKECIDIEKALKECFTKNAKRAEGVGDKL